MDTESRANLGVPVMVFVLAAVGLALSLSLGTHPERANAGTTRPAGTTTNATTHTGH